MSESNFVFMGRCLSDQAAELAAFFELGLCSHRQIVEWADRMISEATEPPIEIIELSLSKPGDDRIPELLEQAGAPAGPAAMRPALLEFMRRLNNRQIGLRDAIARMEHFAQRHAVVVGKDMQDFLIWADDEYDLINQGVQIATHTHDQLRSDFEELLRRSATGSS